MQPRRRPSVPTPVTPQQKADIESLTNEYTYDIVILETLEKVKNLPKQLEMDTLASVGISILCQDNLERMSLSESYTQTTYENLKRLRPIVKKLFDSIQKDIASLNVDETKEVENSDEAVFAMFDRVKNGTFYPLLMLSLTV